MLYIRYKSKKNYFSKVYLFLECIFPLKKFRFSRETENKNLKISLYPPPPPTPFQCKTKEQACFLIVNFNLIKKNLKNIPRIPITFSGSGPSGKCASSSSEITSIADSTRVLFSANSSHF